MLIKSPPWLAHPIFGWILAGSAMVTIACSIAHLVSLQRGWNGNHWVSGALTALIVMATLLTSLFLIRSFPILRPSTTPGRDSGLPPTAAALREDSLFESTGDAIATVTLDGTITGWNPAAERLFGYGKAEIIGKSAAILISPAHEELESRALAAIGRGERVENYQAAYLDKGGRRLEISVAVSPIRDSAGWIIGATKVARDITERVARETALRHNEHCFRNVVDSMSKLVWVARSDGSAFWFNRQWYEYSGSTPGELEGSGWLRFLDPEVLPQYLERWNDAVANRSSFEMECPFRRADGQFRRFRTRVRPIQDPEGNSLLWFGTQTDIEVLKGAETALRVSELAIKAVSQGVLITDCEQNILTVNEAFSAITGYPEAEVLGRNCSFLQGPDSDPNVIEAMRQAIDAHRTFAGEILNYRRDGTSFWNELTISPVRDEFGRVTHFVGVTRDISLRKRADQEASEWGMALEHRVRERTAQLNAANQELEAFSYSVSHDLRAPLRAVDGFAQALVEDYGPQLPADAQRYLRTIRSGAQRMGVLIDNLLAFSRLSRLPLTLQTGNVSALVRQVTECLLTTHRGREINIQYGELPPCEADPALLNQVWENLISNALKYTSKRRQAQIEIGAYSVSGRVVYFVRDNGTGFDMQHTANLFGVFQRLHRQDEFEGTGVGLAIAQRIVHRHGGRIWAEAALDQGATFHFTLGGHVNI